MTEFQFPDHSNKINFLNIVKDNQVVNLTLDKIFDSTLYDELYAISYVTSPRFFSRVVKDFKKIQFVLGIPDGAILNDFADRVLDFFDSKKRVGFWNDLDVVAKEKISKNNFEIRYPTLSSENAISVHSKIYLLKDSQNAANNRVIIGSANLTENAFIKKGQYEEIMIFDNSPLFALYFSRFQSIFEKTVDFVPAELKKIDKTKIIHTTDETTLKNVLLDIASSSEATLIITEADMKSIKEVGIQFEYRKEQVDRTTEVLGIILQKKNNHFKIDTKAKLTKKSVAIQTAICKTNKVSEEIDNRNYLKYVDSEDFLYAAPRKENDLQPFSKQADKEQLFHSLSIINAFVNAYGLFTEHPELRNQSKVFEIILYAFMSPYIWKIRKDYSIEQGRNSVNRNFPPFLIVGGKAGSGKTTILEFITMLLGCNSAEKYWHYSKVEKSGVIQDYFHSENLYPIIIDEVPVNFFKSADQKKGEALIKYISNELTTQHPVLIATTNLSEFSISSQVLTRVYYLEIDKPFDKTQHAASVNHLNHIFLNGSTDLFRDFTYKMSQLIYNKERFYSIEDMLCIGRNIFVQYYKETGLELPEWFPTRIFNDYEERGKRMWKNVFAAHREAFKINEIGDSIFIDINKFSNNEKQRNTLIQYLNASSIQEESAILVVLKKPFYDFIGHAENNVAEITTEQISEMKANLKKELVLEMEKEQAIEKLLEHETNSLPVVETEKPSKNLIQRFKSWFKG
jgi:NgoFVII restriction endonuclease